MFEIAILVLLLYGLCRPPDSIVINVWVALVHAAASRFAEPPFPSTATDLRILPNSYNASEQVAGWQPWAECQHLPVHQLQ
jgi:hypothetical protein